MLLQSGTYSERAELELGPHASPSRQRGSRLRVSEEVLVLRAASVRGPCGDVNRRVVSETSGSPARLITGLPK
ncbi:hypothetical protein EYF80_003982 [Liparis tanakae]|uniref:Uncharacterized protein n=1 Tax=Liparis tanakae TaxID=230148 RepID=A0A4Z2J5S3_9TELE|nr:hypothetical protein EYF80_003982 [Liparis tanakae]